MLCGTGTKWHYYFFNVTYILRLTTVSLLVFFLFSFLGALKGYIHFVCALASRELPVPPQQKTGWSVSHSGDAQTNSIHNIKTQHIAHSSNVFGYMGYIVLCIHTYGPKINIRTFLCVIPGPGRGGLSGEEQPLGGDVSWQINLASSSTVAPTRGLTKLPRWLASVLQLHTDSPWLYWLCSAVEKITLVVLCNYF